MCLCGSGDQTGACRPAPVPLAVEGRHDLVALFWPGPPHASRARLTLRAAPCSTFYVPERPLYFSFYHSVPQVKMLAVKLGF